MGYKYCVIPFCSKGWGILQCIGFVCYTEKKQNGAESVESMVWHILDKYI